MPGRSSCTFGDFANKDYFTFLKNLNTLLALEQGKYAIKMPEPKRFVALLSVHTLIRFRVVY